MMRDVVMSQKVGRNNCMFVHRMRDFYHMSSTACSCWIELDSKASKIVYST